MSVFNGGVFNLYVQRNLSQKTEAVIKVEHLVTQLPCYQRWLPQKIKGGSPTQISIRCQAWCLHLWSWLYLSVSRAQSNSYSTWIEACVSRGVLILRIVSSTLLLNVRFVADILPPFHTTHAFECEVGSKFCWKLYLTPGFYLYVVAHSTGTLSIVTVVPEWFSCVLSQI